MLCKHTEVVNEIANIILKVASVDFSIRFSTVAILLWMLPGDELVRNLAVYLDRSHATSPVENK
jgi:hypothetical protein